MKPDRILTWDPRWWSWCLWLYF